MNHNLNIQTRKPRVSLTYAGLFFAFIPNEFYELCLKKVLASYS